MNVYDFDETIFTGDSEDRFFEFMFAKKGFKHYKIFWQFWNRLWKLHIVPKTVSREHQYKFLKDIKDLDATLEEYWDEVEKYMKPWYNEVKKDDDMIASGTPRFLLEPMLKRLGLKNLVATEMDSKTGKIDGDFAIDKYKLVNFLKDWPEDSIDKFYSDAYTDHFLADIAKEAYVIHDGEQFTEWKQYCKEHPEFTQPKKR